MKVSQLIKALKTAPPDADVFFDVEAACFGVHYVGVDVASYGSEISGAFGHEVVTLATLEPHRSCDTDAVTRERDEASERAATLENALVFYWWKSTCDDYPHTCSGGNDTPEDAARMCDVCKAVAAALSPPAAPKGGAR